MAEASRIAWTDSTFNAWIGCQKVSPACTHCYAEVDTFARSRRANGLELWGPKAARHVTSDAYWKQPLRWEKQAAASGVRRRVFCSSLSDVFEDRKDLDEPRARLFRLILQTPHLDWLLLTKRPEDAGRLWRMAALAAHGWEAKDEPEVWGANVQLGTTVENQEYADARIGALLAVEGPKLRFLSCEPLLGPIELLRVRAGEALAPNNPNHHVDVLRGGTWAFERYGFVNHSDMSRVDWVIVGGESGTKARPFDVAWARSLVTQCSDAGVAVFVKQMGALPQDHGLQTDWAVGTHFRQGVGPGSRVVLKEARAGSDMAEWPADLQVRQFPNREAAALRRGNGRIEAPAP